uniref:Uncharacterized protein n=1 Tax=viral metagenome TaxID=1070528 RepID=A0A6C0EUD8_9ZZZZ
MEYIWLIAFGIALLILVFYKSNPIEKMTNKDLLSTLSTFGTKGTKPKPKDPYEEPIYGPKAPKLADPVPAPAKGKSDDSGDTYPDIYGPEITPVPGKKKHTKTGKHSSDDHGDDEPYQFNPDLEKAFPMEENEPQPFLTDFSKFQH